MLAAVFAILQLEEEEERNEIRRIEMLRRRQLRDISDPFMMGDNIFHHRYRMYPWVSIEKQGFEERLGFPGVIGAIDCTLPKIRAPVDHEEAYLNYKQEHSFCVQTVCDVNYNILNIRICSGSTNDRFVWRHSAIRQEMLRLRNDAEIVEEEGHYYLIGDNGYTPSTVLLTAVAGAQRNTPEYLFSDTLRRTRCRIEQTFGIWKQIMRCINAERSLLYEPEFGANIVLSTGVLYNFLRHHGMPLPEPAQEERVGHFYFEDDQEYVLGLAERQRIIEQFFTPDE